MPFVAELSAADRASLAQRCGATVRQLRGERGLTQRELAVRSGLQRSYLADVERGRRHLSLTNVARVATRLSVPLSIFFARLEAMRPAAASP